MENGELTMTEEKTRIISFVSSYLPRRCGIATFCSDLIGSVTAAAGGMLEPVVAAMTSGDEHCDGPPVKIEIRRNVKNDYISAADYLNFSHVDMVCVQHEYGLFGGPAGAYLNLLLQRVNAPVVATMHTVLQEPSEEYYRSTLDLCALCDRVVVLNQKGVEMLSTIYGVDPEKIVLIPHGIPDLPFVETSYYKHKFGMEGRKTILTFGLLNRNKGIENMLKAMPAIVEADPRALYIVLGATHPEVLRNDGEEYRFELQRIVEEMGLQDHVLFYNQFVSTEQLHRFLCAADIYVTPYLHRQQITSGTLAFAVGTGKVVVSTPYWAAEELLADGRGRLVGFNDPRQLAEAIIEVLSNEELAFTLRRKAYDYGRNITWPLIGKQYWQLFNSIPSTVTVTLPREEKKWGSLKKLPEPSLQHLREITDDTGLLQHAKFTIPDRRHGYCTDDNARAMVAMLQYNSQYPDPEIRQYIHRYLSFVLHAQRPDGTFYNFMGFDRQWIHYEPAHDSLGRALWALSIALCNPMFREMIPILKHAFRLSLPHISSLSPRGRAYAIFGLAAYLKQFPGDSEPQLLLNQSADFLCDLYRRHSAPGWQWFEPVISYEGALLPHGLFTAFRVTDNKKYLQIALDTCRFLLDSTYNGKHFSFIGCHGWYPRGGPKASFDQQPIEAASTVLMLREAGEATGDGDYLHLQKEAFDWFLGRNDLQIPVYDFRTRGCYDGLEEKGVNLNQGAESMVCFLLALLSIVENFSTEKKLISRSRIGEPEKMTR